MRNGCLFDTAVIKHLEKNAANIVTAESFRQIIYKAPLVSWRNFEFHLQQAYRGVKVSTALFVLQGSSKQTCPIYFLSFLSFVAAGLLTRDPRRRERKKPGQEGARRKFTW